MLQRHYIRVDAQNRIVDGWSDGPHANRDTTGAICINEEGSYQFRLMPDGEENPTLRTMEDLPLYSWNGERAVLRTEEDLAADRADLPTPPPSAQEQLRADVDFLAAIQGVSL